MVCAPRRPNYRDAQQRHIWADGETGAVPARLSPPLFADIADQFDVIKTMADGQREFLHGVIEFYQTRTATHMAIAAEKSAATDAQQNEDMRRITAWVAIVAVPAAVTGFFGQNVLYPGFGTTGGFIASALAIVTFAATLFLIFRSKNWL